MHKTQERYRSGLCFRQVVFPGFIDAEGFVLLAEFYEDENVTKWTQIRIMTGLRA